MPADTLYNRRLLDIIHNYNEVNAYATRLTNMSPELRVGSGRPREFILAEGHSPAWSGLDMFDRSLPIAVRGDMNESVGGVNRLKKANKWTGYALDTADKALGLATKYGGVSRSKKAKKWTGYALDTADKALGLATKYGGVSRSKKAKKWTDYSIDTLEKGLALGEKYGGVNRNKKAKKWTGYALDTADKALGLATKYGAGEKPKVARFAKGSQEMKDKMAKLRAMRK